MIDLSNGVNLVACGDNTMKHTILIVDDDISYVDILQILLEEEGFDVKTASHGKQAKKLIEHTKVDLVLLDLQMPEVGGFDVLDYMNDHASKTKIPVIVVTANCTDENIDLANKKGALDIVHKPFLLDNLIYKIKKSLGMQEQFGG